MNDNVREEVRWLDKYVFHLSPKQYLSLAWSIIPKQSKTPFIKYIKKDEEKTDHLKNNIVPKIRQYLKLDDTDWKYEEEDIMKAVYEKPEDWFKFFGMPKSYWDTFNIDFEKVKG